MHTVLEGPQGEIRIPNARFMDSVLVREEGLSLQVTLPSGTAWKALEQIFPVRFEPLALSPEGLQGVLYLREKDLDAVLAWTRGLAASQAPQG